LPDIVKFSFVLMITAAIAAGALGGIYTAAKPRIDEQERLREENAKKAVLPQAAEGIYVEVDSEDDFEYFEGYADKERTQLVGYTFVAEGKGYSSTIRTVVGVDLSGVVTGIKIIFQQETPGLGAKVEEVASTTTLWSTIGNVFTGGAGEPAEDIAPWFQEQFVGKSVKSLEVIKGETDDKIESLTGATISSEAVTRSVREGIERLSEAVGGFSDVDQEEVS
jgi:electron transport complex protein RnfG